MIKVKAMKPGGMCYTQESETDVFIDPTSIDSVTSPQYSDMRFYYGFEYTTKGGGRFYYGLWDSVENREQIVDAYHKELLSIVGVLT